MKTTTPLLALMAMLLMLAPAQAAEFVIDTTNEDDAYHRHSIHEEPVDVASTETNITSLRVFHIDAPADAYLFLAPGSNDAPAVPDGYTVDLEVSTDGVTFTSLAEGINGTDISTRFAVTDEATVRATLHIPVERVANSHVMVRIIIAVDGCEDQGGNGGCRDPSISHTLDVFYYDAATDSDADGLPDAWEDKHFGHLDYLGSDDPDKDGYSNTKEYQAGTDPNNAASVPAETAVSGGGYDLNDRELGLTIAGFFLTVIVMALLVMFLPRQEEKKAMAIAATLGFSLLATLVVLFALDVMEVAGNGWAWWSYLGVTWQETAVGLAVLSAVGITAAFTFLKLNEREEVKAAYAFLAAALVAVGALFLVFGVFDVPVPFIE